MHTTPATDVSAFLLATTLSERIELRGRDSNGHHEAVDEKDGAARLKEWEAQFGRDTGLVFKDRWSAGLLSRRLRAASLERNDFTRILGETAESLGRRHDVLPRWLEDLLKQLDADVASHPSDLQIPSEGNSTLPSDTSPLGELQILAPLEPLIENVVSRFRRRVNQLFESHDLDAGHLLETESPERHFISHLIRSLAAQVESVFVLELNVARLAGKLEGDTGEQRFRSFASRLRQPACRREFFREYPVLARSCCVTMEQWLETNLELIERLCLDREILSARFNAGRGLGQLTGLSFLGDRHRGGRAVAKLEFSDGTKVVYKPKSLSPEVHLNELLDFLNSLGATPTFRTLDVLDKGEYGWCEYLHPHPCRTLKEVENFYRRGGAYLALLYALQSADMHYENLLACGEHPMIVDAETILHVQTRGAREEEWKPIFGVISECVLRVGLLPRRLAADEEYEGWESGSMAAMPGQRSIFEQRVWEKPGTDEVRAAYRRLHLPDSNNLPTFNGAHVNLPDYRGEFESGFVDMYCLLAKNKDLLLVDDGPIAQFADDELRFLMRPTRAYALLLLRSRHPDYYRNALDRDLLFELLWKFSQDNDLQFPLIPYEIEDLRRGQIPVLFTRGNSKDLWTGAGDLIPDFFAETCLDQARRKIQELSPNDLERQLWFVRTSMINHSSHTEHFPEKGRPHSSRKHAARLGASEQATSEDLLAEAKKIGDKLEGAAITGRGARWFCMNWFLQPDQERSILSLANAGIDIYNGVTGITLFLSYLAVMTGEKRYSELAHEGLKAVLEMAEEMGLDVHDKDSVIALVEPVRREQQLEQIGAFKGWGGLVYTLTHLWRLWQEPRLMDLLESSILPRIAIHIEADEDYDVLSGSAGCLVALLGLDSLAPSSRSLELAVRCGQQIVDAAQAMHTGKGWPREKSGGAALTGFAHGTAGIAWALLKLAARTGDEGFRQAALAAIEYERSLFSPSRQNWLDLRPFDEGPLPRSFHCAWCHGAPGIGMARLDSLPHLDDRAMLKEIEAALTTTLAEGFGTNHSLCHGDLGNAELLLLARDRMDDPRARLFLDDLCSRLLEDIRQHGWVCGLQDGFENPGLMNGLAGIGFGLLRLADPIRVPSVLLLEPPR